MNRTAWRVVGVVLAVTSAVVLNHVVSADASAGVRGAVAFAGFLLALGATGLLAPALLDPLAARLAPFLAGALGGNERASAFARVRTLLSHHRAHDAYQVLDALSKRYPRDAAIYARMMEIAYESLGDAAMAERAYVRGIASVIDERGREVLRRRRSERRISIELDSPD